MERSMLCDHNMLVVECMVGRKSEVKVKEKRGSGD